MADWRQQIIADAQANPTVQAAQNPSLPGHYTGTGSPNGVLAAAVGSTYTRSDGGNNTTFYVKETGGSTASGWTAK